MMKLTILAALAIFAAHASADDVITKTYPDGKPQSETRKRGGKQHGVQVWWSSSGARNETTYDRGVQHGPYVSYFANGAKQVEGQYEHGQRTGRWIEYERDGDVLFEKTYRFGKRHGEHVQYGDGTGPRKGRRLEVRRTAYVYGLEHGETIEYWNNGHVQSRGAHVLGRREGTWQFFAMDGRPLKQVAYRCGKKTTASVEGAGESCPPARVSIGLPVLPHDATLDGNRAATQFRLKQHEVMCALARELHALGKVELHVGGRKLACGAKHKIRTKSGMAGGGTRG